ncbi:MAG: hypothetical protein GY861_15980 [bacterium]|nr:hypothetical protein [bacterium]
MIPDQTHAINDIQRSNLTIDKGFVCQAVQEYYKLLQQAQAIKPKKKKVKKEAPKEEVKEEPVVEPKVETKIETKIETKVNEPKTIRR